MLRLALATCEGLPDWESDDHALHRALVDRGVDLGRPAWTDTSFNWAGCDSVVIRTTWDYTNRADDFVAWAERVARVTRLFNPAEVVRWNTQKTYLRDLASHGVRTVPTVWLGPATGSIDLAAEMRSRQWDRGFIKPAIGATARETMRFTLEGGEPATEHRLGGADGLPVHDRARLVVPPLFNVEAALRHVERLLDRGETVLVQPYLDSVESRGEFSAIFIDGAITHTIRKIPVSGDYRVQDDFNGRDEACEFPREHLAFATHAIEAVGAVLGEPGRDLLYARTDFLLDAEGKPCLTELEAVEPSLFFRHCPRAAERLAEAIIRRASATRRH